MPEVQNVQNIHVGVVDVHTKNLAQAEESKSDIKIDKKPHNKSDPEALESNFCSLSLEEEHLIECATRASSREDVQDDHMLAHTW